MADMSHLFDHPGQVFGYDNRCIRKELDQRYALRFALRETRSYGQLVDLTARQLGANFESTHRVNLVAEEVDAIGIFARITEHVENGASHGHLPRLVHIIDTFEAEFQQAFYQTFALRVFAAAQMDDFVGHVDLSRHLFGQCLGVSDNDERLLACDYTPDDIGSQNLVGGIHLSVFDAATIARREKRHAVLACRLADVVKEIAGSILVVQDAQECGLNSLLNGREEGGCRRPDQSAQVNALRTRTDIAHTCPCAEFLDQSIEPRLLQNEFLYFVHQRDCIECYDNNI